MGQTGNVTLVVGILLLLVAGCQELEQPPELGRINPPGYVEKYLPKFASTKFMYLPEQKIVWARCFNCDLDWDDLRIYISNEMSVDNWRESTADWFKREKYSRWEDALHDGFMCVFTSPEGDVQLYVLNLRYLRKLGGDAGTSGDYYVLTGYDRLDNYKLADEDKRR